MRKFMGNVPDLEDGWEWVGEVEGVSPGWDVYYRPAQDDSIWESYKVVAGHPLPRKANYWLARHVGTGELLRRRVQMQIENHSRELWECVEWIMDSWG